MRAARRLTARPRLDGLAARAASRLRERELHAGSFTGLRFSARAAYDAFLGHKAFSVWNDVAPCVAISDASALAAVRETASRWTAQF
jgi:hypothetical protein